MNPTQKPNVMLAFFVAARNFLTPLCLHPQYELIKTFDKSLAKAKLSLEEGKQESLYNVASGFFETFEKARNQLANHRILPVIPGNDPHSHEKMDDHTAKLSLALSGVYGFASSAVNAARYPKTIDALRDLQPIASALHACNFAIHT